MKVLFHLNEGFTKVLVEKTIGGGLADGRTTWDIPTEKIPFHLRQIGSRVAVSTDVNSFESIEITEV